MEARTAEALAQLMAYTADINLLLKEIDKCYKRHRECFESLEHRDNCYCPMVNNKYTKKTCRDGAYVAFVNTCGLGDLEPQVFTAIQEICTIRHWDKHSD